jgi:4-amino-4-deoxy-L-arabinose transferase-like glycosyltransferase
MMLEYSVKRLLLMVKHMAGMIRTPGERRRSGLVAGGCLVCLLSLAFGFQGARGVWQPDEGYYVGTAVTMMEGGDMFVPRLGENIFLEKPPMLYWGIIAGVRLLGQNEFAVRAFNAFCYLGTVVVVGLLSTSIFGQKRYGLTAAFIYATMVIPFIAANFVTPDTPLTFWTTLSAFFFWKSSEPEARRVWMWKLLLCGAVGAGFMAKGPAVFIPCAGFFVFLLIRGQIVKYFFTKWTIWGLGIFCVIGLTWYLYAGLTIPGAARYFVDNQIWGRLVSGKYDRNPGLGGALIYLPVLVFGTLPWSTVWWEKRKLLKTSIFHRSWWLKLRYRRRALFLMCWFAPPLLVLCLASSKLGLYTLPLFPALALAVAEPWTQKLSALLERGQGGDFPRPFVRPAVLMAGWALLLLGSRLVLAWYPVENDTRALWSQIRPHLTDGSYEILTVDERQDGLLFYGAEEVEHITNDDDPYPTFQMPESMEEELEDVGMQRHAFYFLVRKAHRVQSVRDVLLRAGISFREIPLSYGRVLLVCAT